MPSAYVAEATRAHTTGGPPEGEGYGYLWWVGDDAFFARRLRGPGARRRAGGAARRGRDGSRGAAAAGSEPAPRGGTGTRVTALVGIDVGTTGVKALALSRPAILARAEREYALSTPRPGWSSRPPTTGRGRRTRRSPTSASSRRRSGGAARCTASSCSTSAARCCGRRSSGTPAHGGRVRRARGGSGSSACPADRQPRPDRLHGAEAALAAHTSRTPTPASATCCSPRTTSALPPQRRARHRRRRRVGHASVRRREPVLERRGARGAGAAARWLPEVHESTEIGGAGDRPRGPSASASSPPALSVVLGTSVVFAALDEYRPEPEARLHAFCHAVPGTWHAMGDALRGRVASVAPGGLRRRALRRAAGRGRGVAAGNRGPPFSALPPGRAHAPRRPGARGAFAASRSAPRRARSRRAGRGRVRPARLARASPRNRRRGRGGPGVGGRGAEQALAADRRLGARPAARAERRPRKRALSARRSWAGSRRVRGRARSRGRVRPRPRPDRARPWVAGLLRRRLRSPATGSCTPP